jgi:hypothetical protein
VGASVSRPRIFDYAKTAPKRVPVWAKIIIILALVASMCIGGNVALRWFAHNFFHPI